MALSESLVGVLPVVGPHSFPGGAPVIANLDGGDGSGSAKPLGALEMEGDRSIPAKIPDGAQILGIEYGFLH